MLSTKIPGLRYFKKETESKECGESKSKLSWTEWQWVKKNILSFKDETKTQDDQIFKNMYFFWASDSQSLHMDDAPKTSHHGLRDSIYPKQSLV